MARGVNKAIIVGNLGDEPKVYSTKSGGHIASISVATSESWKDKQTGQMQERTEWHRVVFHNRLAEIVGQYLHKGSKVYVEGSLRTREWDDKGIKKYTTEVIAKDLQMLDSRNEGQQKEQWQPMQYGPSGAANNPQAGGGQLAPQAPIQQQHHQQQNNQSMQPQQQPAFDDFDDDIPF